MCRIPRVLIVAPADQQLELRKTLSSLEYDIAATVDSFDAATAVKADVAVVWEPDGDTVAKLAAVGFKTVAIGGERNGADMAIDPDDISAFKTRIWELYRPA